MKKAFLLIIFLLISNPVIADNQGCYSCKSAKCMDLKTSMHNERATLYNVLNLSDDQQKCKDTIDKKYFNEIGNCLQKLEQEEYVLNNMKKLNASKSSIKKQQNVVKNIEKDIEKIKKKYNKEFKSILNSEQKTKFKTISKMEKNKESYCKNRKAFTERDPKFRIFGENAYYGDSKKIVCPVHNKHHIFGIIHKEK